MVSLAWYSVGTLSVTNNSAVVTGTGTQFATYIHDGFGIFIEGIGYGIATVDSATQITLAENYVGTTKSNARYSIWPTAGLNFQQWRDVVDLVNTFGPLRNDLTLLNQQIADTLDYKNSASASAIAAAQSASNAAASATAAANSATNSANSASAAAGSATSATNSKNAAASSATAAANSASDANASKQAAATSASAAATSESNAATSKSGADTAKTAAQTAQTAAEAARDAAVTAKGASETARDASVTAKNSAQTAQSAAEGARDNALNYKNAASTSATAAATSEANAATSKADAQTAKSAAESARDAAVTAKDASVAAKTGSETAKTAAETARDAAQQAQAAAELAAGQAQEPVNAGAIEDALGGTPALLEGSTFSGAIKGPTIYAGDPAYFRGEHAVEMGGSSGSYGVNIQDGQGRVNHYWNTAGGNAPVQSLENEDAFRLTLGVDSPSLELFGHDGSGQAAGTSIAWSSVFRAAMADSAPTFRSQAIYHTGNISGAPISTATQTALNAKAPLAAPTFTGTVTSTGTVAAATSLGNSIQLTTDGAIEIQKTDGWPYIDFKTTSNQDYQVRVQADCPNSSLNVTGHFRTSGSYNAGGYIASAGFVRATGNLIVDGGTSEGGQIILGYKNVTNLSGQGNGTWNIDVDSSNSLRFFRQSTSGATTSPPLTITEAGEATFNQPISVVGANQAYFRSATGSYPTTIHRNDGTNYYILLSDASTGVNPNWNALRPLTINLSTGVVTSTNGQTFSGGMTVNDTATFNSPINGRAYPRKADGNAMNMYWSGQSGQPNWVWGGSDGTNMYVYNPSNFNVNSATTASNASNLNNLTGGNQGSYIRRSNDSAANGGWSRQLVVAGGDAQDNVWSPPIEIREVSLVGSGSTSSINAPGLLFHWSNVTAAKLAMHSDGSLRVQGQADTVSYRPLYAADFMASNWFRPLGSGGVYWNAYSRGLTVADNGGNYGNVNIYGSGRNGWMGYAINTGATFMSDGSTHGIHSQQYGDWLVRWDSSGNAYFPQNVTAYSDERLKDNKRPIDNVAARREGMAKAAMLYERDGETRIGFGAQTLEKAVPEVVKTADDLVATKSVNYSDMVAILAADNQQQADQIAELKSENAQLRNSLAALENRLTKAGL